MAFWGFNLTRDIICQWFFVDIPVYNAKISGKKNVVNNKEVSSDLRVRFAFAFGGEVKPSVPCRRFTACKRFLNASGSRAFQAKEVGHFRQNSSAISRPPSSTFGY